MKPFAAMLLVCGLLLLLPSQVLAADCTAAATGNWSTPATWSNCGGSTPGAADSATIPASITVTIDTDITIASLVVSGTLTFDSTARNVSAGGDVTINSGGTFITQASGAATHTLAIGGNLTNNGTFDMSRGGTTLVCAVTFNKDGNQTISGSGATTRFHTLTLDMGASNANVLDVQAIISMASDGLTLTNGTFKLSSASTLTPFSGSTTIGSTAGYHLNHANAVSNWGSSGSLTVEGALTIANGTMTVGANTGNSLTINGSSANVQISGGALNITGRWRQKSGGSSNTLNITGGTINVSTAGQTNSSTIATFQVPGGNNFSMSGGAITIYNANANAGGDLKITNSSASITGGTFIIGNGDSTTGDIQIRSDASLNDLTIDAGATTPKLVADITVCDLAVSSGATLDAQTYTITIAGGCALTNNGTIRRNSTQTVDGSSGTVTFNDHVGQASAQLTSNGANHLGDTTVTVQVSDTLPANAFNTSCPARTAAVRRYFNISPTMITGVDATVQLGYLDGELNSNTESKLAFWHCSNDIWSEQIGAHIRDTTNNTVSLSGMDGFSPFVLQEQTLKWRFNTTLVNLAAASVLPSVGVAFTGGNAGTARAINTSTGAQNWSFDATSDGAGAIQARAPIVAVGGVNYVLVTSQNGYVYALSASNGSQIWKQDLRRSGQGSDKLNGSVGVQRNVAVTASGACNGQTKTLVFVGTYRTTTTSANAIYALDITDGATCWSYTGGGSNPNVDFLPGGPVVSSANNTVYFAGRANGGTGQPGVWALNTQAGSLRWSSNLGDIDSRPTLNSAATTLYVGTNGGTLYALNTSDGSIRWSLSVGGQLSGFVWPDGSTLYFGTLTNNRFWSVIDNGASASVNANWGGGNGYVGVAGPTAPLVLSSQNRIFVGSTDGYVYQLDTADGLVTGQVKFVGATPGDLTFDVLKSTLYVGGTDGYVNSIPAPFP